MNRVFTSVLWEQCIKIHSFISGIGGLENHILKSATISSTVACPAFTDMYFDAAPIMRVAVEPVSPSMLI